VTNRTFNVLRQLTREYDVSVLAFSRRNHQPDEAARGKAEADLAAALGVTVRSVPIPSESSVLGRVLVHASTLISRRPYTYAEYASPLIERWLDEELRLRRPAMIHVDSLDLYRWLRDVTGLPVAVTHHSVESDLLRIRADHHPNRVLAAYLRYQSHLLEAVEREYCERVAVNVMMSEVDAARLRRLAPAARTYVAPNGVDVDFFTPTSPHRQRPERIIFLGPTYMYPNRDGLDYFIGQVWPRVRSACPEATLHLVGRNSEEDRRRYSEVPGVVPRGFVDDIREPFAEAACSVVPLRIGGGTRLKILDSWAMGKAVVSTSVGCEGLAAHEGENILVRDDPAKFADAVVAVLTDVALREKLAAGGRETAAKQYSWDRVGEGLRKCYQTLIEGGT